MAIGFSALTHGLKATALLAAVLVISAPVSAQEKSATEKITPVHRKMDGADSSAGVAAGISAAKKSTIFIQLGKAHLVKLPGRVRDVIVPNPAVVDVVDIVKRPTEVYLVAKSIGETNVFFVGDGGQLMLHAEAVVQIGLEGARAALAAVFPDGKIQLKSVNKSIVLSGTVRSAQESANAASIVRTFVQNDTDVINMLHIVGDQQVLLKVRVAEIQRTVVKNLGSSLAFGVNDGVSFATVGAAAGPAAAVFGTLDLDSGTISALEERGLAKTLAEPALVSVSGETANFLAGGEFPVPTGRDENNNITIQFKKFGVSLSFTPVVLSTRQINLRIKTEVSRLDSSEQIELFNTTVKGLSVRRADSTVNMTSGGSIMIAGLLQNDEFNQVQGLPWFKDIPVLGALFSSKGFQNNQTELVVMVTAYTVRPTQPGTKLALPTDGFVPASDFDFYLLGRLYKRYAKRARPDTVPVVKGPVGYLME